MREIGPNGIDTAPRRRIPPPRPPQEITWIGDGETFSGVTVHDEEYNGVLMRAAHLPQGPLLDNEVDLAFGGPSTEEARSTVPALSPRTGGTTKACPEWMNQILHHHGEIFDRAVYCQGTAYKTARAQRCSLCPQR